MTAPDALQQPESSRLDASPFCPPAVASNDGAASQCPCECVWVCMRGRTNLTCQLDVHADGLHKLTLLRNRRTYGQYEFRARDAALTFAARLRHTFAGNGWA